MVQRLQEAVDLGGGVVVQEPGADRAAAPLQAEAFHDVEGVVVAVPGEDPRLAERLGDRVGRLALDSEAQRRGALPHPRRVGDPVEPQLGQVGHTIEEAQGERGLVSLDAREGVVEPCPPACSWGRVGAGAEAGEVVDRRDHPGEALVGLGAGLEAVPGRGLGGGADLVGGERLGEVAADRGDADVRPEELVGRAEHHVDAERGGVDAAVRRGVDRVAPGQRPDPVGGGGDPGDVGDGPERIGGQRERHHLGARAEQTLQRVVVEGAVGDPQRRGADHQAVVAGDQQPRRHVGVVVERGDHDLVPGGQGPRERVGEQEVQGGHVGPEGDPLRGGPEQVGPGGAGPLHQRGGLPGGGEGAVEVGHGRLQVPGDRDDRRGVRLRPARPVEEDRRASVGERARQPGELRADRLDVDPRHGRR